jgi:hypothetical protein
MMPLYLFCLVRMSLQRAKKVHDVNCLKFVMFPTVWSFSFVHSDQRTPPTAPGELVEAAVRFLRGLDLFHARGPRVYASQQGSRRRQLDAVRLEAARAVLAPADRSKAGT